MLAKYAFKISGLLLALAWGCSMNLPALGMSGYGADQLVQGEVQSIDYLQHAITVNGQSYRVSPQAKFNGIGAFSVLHVGMPVQLMLGSARGASMAAPSSPGDVSAQNEEPQVVIQVTWLPNGV
jgi:hypothetical protein